MNLDDVSIELPMLAVVCTLFQTPKSGYRTAKVSKFETRFPQLTPKKGNKTATICRFSSQLQKIAIELPPFWMMQNSQSDKNPKIVPKTAKVCSCMGTMHMNSEKF